MNAIFLTLIILSQICFVAAQSIPRNHFFYQSRKVLYDSGRDWKYLTTFGPMRFESASEDAKSSFWKNGDLSFSVNNRTFTIHALGRMEYKDHFFAYSYPQLSRRINDEQKQITETEFTSVNSNYSGFGFKNNWILLQIGKGKESWGAGNDIQLALSDKSKNYTYLLLGSDYGRIRVRYIYGFLENVRSNINRYITARGIEWSNKKSLVIGFSETVIYSGENRSFDIGYLNPISSHLEIELNNRLNIIGDSNSNAVWQFHLDIIPMKNLRFSLNYLIDEFVFDPDIQLGKEHGKAYSTKLAYSPLMFQKSLLSFNLSFVHVGTPTFRHGIGTNNFVQDGIPLGWPGGSDGKEVCFGLDYYDNNNIVASLLTGYRSSGEESINSRIFETYADYQKGKFPSGEVVKSHFSQINISYNWRDCYLFSIAFENFSKRNLLLFTLSVKIPDKVIN